MNMPMQQPQQQRGIPFLSPVGRYVGGDLFEVMKSDTFGNQPQRTQSGEEKEEFVVKLAYRKDDPNFGPFWEQLKQIGHKEFPHLGQIPNFWDPQNYFSWKIQDGDGLDGNRKPNANKPGHAGCWIVKFSSKFKPRCHYIGRHAPNEQITDPKVIPYGHYIRIGGTTQGNKQQQKPGIYINLDLVEYVYGTETDILDIGGGGMSAAQMFATPPVLPAGVQAITLPPAGLPMGAPQMPGIPGAAPAGLPPLAAPGAMPGMPGAAPVGLPPAAAPAGVPVIPGFSAPTMPAPAMPAPGATPPSMPSQVAVQPHPAILAGPQGMPAAPARQMTALAGAYTYEQYIAAGHTDATLRQAGLML